MEALYSFIFTEFFLVEQKHRFLYYQNEKKLTINILSE